MPDPSAKTILITGATDGIGRIAAERLAREGAKLLVHGRDQRRLDETVAAIREATGNDRVRGYRADFGALARVRDLARRVLEEQPRLDVLINNAGIGTVTGGSRGRMVSEDGHELRFQVNYLAPFLLTRFLLPRLADSAPARVVNVASAAQAEIDFDDVMLERGYEGMRAYSQSKLALVMFTFSLAERLDPGKVTVNALHPGSLLDTKMVREGFGRPWERAEEGADAEIHLAVAPELDGVSGRYFDQRREARAHAQAYDERARARLWRLSERLTGLQEDPGAAGPARS